MLVIFKHFHRFSILVLFSVASIGCMGSEETFRANQNSLVGAWTLVSWESQAMDGTVTQPYGPNPMGQIVYSGSGRMSAQLMHPTASLPEATNTTAEEMSAAIFGRFFSYYGSYTVDEESSIVIHHVEGALLPTWVETERPRSFTFDGRDRVILNTMPDELRTSGAVSTLIWQRVSDS